MNRTAAVLSGIALVATASILVAGPLNPPAGAVAPTFKTLGDVEPRIAISAANTPGDQTSVFRITQPGSYYLTGNLSGVSGKNGVRVLASNVTIDLNGFTLTGGAGSLKGIAVDPGQGCTIRNGMVTGWGVAGIDSFRNGTILEKINANANAGPGIEVTNAGRVVDCVSIGNAGRGIIIGNESVITGCVVQANISGDSFTGGIYASDRCVVTGCTAAFNTGAGITAGSGSRVSDCQSGQNQEGFNSYGPALFAGCVARSNDTDGFHVAMGSTVRDCHATGNGDDGIEADTRSVITGNNCSDNGPSAAGAGVFVRGSSCRVEDNNVEYNHTGILVGGSATDCFVVKNSSRGNGVNYSVPASNELAPVITNPGANGFATMTAWSNVAY